MAETQPQTDSKQANTSGCLIRLFWMLFGNAGLLIMARVIWTHEGPFPSWADFAFWVIFGALVLLRHVDISKYGGLTATGKPATLRDWRLYALGLGVVSLAIWGLAHAAAHFRWLS